MENAVSALKGDEIKPNRAILQAGPTRRQRQGGMSSGALTSPPPLQPAVELGESSDAGGAVLVDERQDADAGGGSAVDVLARGADETGGIGDEVARGLVDGVVGHVPSRYIGILCNAIGQTGGPRHRVVSRPSRGERVRLDLVGEDPRGGPTLEVVEHVVADLLAVVGEDVVATTGRQGDLETRRAVVGLDHQYAQTTQNHCGDWEREQAPEDAAVRHRGAAVVTLEFEALLDHEHVRNAARPGESPGLVQAVDLGG